MYRFLRSVWCKCLCDFVLWSNAVPPTLLLWCNNLYQTYTISHSTPQTTYVFFCGKAIVSISGEVINLWAQQMRVDVTIYRCLSLAEPIHSMILSVICELFCRFPLSCKMFYFYFNMIYCVQYLTDSTLYDYLVDIQELCMAFAEFTNINSL